MRVTAVGDCGVDRYLELGRDRPGGITLNFAANARRLFPGTDTVGVVTALGTDREARLVRRAIAELGLEACLAELEGATSIQYIDHPVHRPPLLGREDLRALRAGGPGPLPAGCTRARGHRPQRRGHGRRLRPDRGLLRFRDGRALAGAAGGGFRRPGRRHGRGGHRRALPPRLSCRLLRAERERGALIDALERLARRQRQLFVVTLGGHGSLVLGGEERLSCPAVQVAQVVDTMGAGDTFAAGFLREYCGSRDAGRSLARGAEEAAASVQRVGAFSWDD